MVYHAGSYLMRPLVSDQRQAPRGKPAASSYAAAIYVGNYREVTTHCRVDRGRHLAIDQVEAAAAEGQEYRPAACLRPARCSYGNEDSGRA